MAVWERRVAKVEGVERGCRERAWRRWLSSLPTVGHEWWWYSTMIHISCKYGGHVLKCVREHNNISVSRTVSRAGSGTGKTAFTAADMKGINTLWWKTEIAQHWDNETTRRDNMNIATYVYSFHGKHTCSSRLCSGPFERPIMKRKWILGLYSLPDTAMRLEEW